ncbi:MAG: EcsC family protein [Methylobacteriaceae bacterium]|nr:EcsC family protein [Methylobacteriaceae bacterium]MBV9392776.1 EcsC family protein [Methylobacteriaceae bacterium]
MQALDVVDTAAAPPTTAMSPEDEAALAEAVAALERMTFAGRLTEMVGRQIDFAGKLVPQPISGAVGKAVTLALRAALRVALTGLSKPRGAHASAASRRRLHRALVTASGAVGGAFGLISLPVELPVSTTLILRSIAEIARSEGENLDDPEAALACLQVFALGGQPGTSDLVEGGYFALRGFLAKSVSEAARHIAVRGVGGETAPILLRLMSQIAARFGLVVTQKVAAQAVPVLGAVGGAAVNLAFAQHFQSLARGHFIVRRLERTYGHAPVRAAYERIAAGLRRAADMGRNSLTFPGGKDGAAV